MTEADRIHPDKLYSPAQVADLEGCCIALVYKRLAGGEYSAFKDGRSTRIYGASVIDRRQNKLKVATFKQPTKQPNRLQTLRKPADASSA
jgi:hypothetical protein